MDAIETLESRAAALSEMVTERLRTPGPDLVRQARRLGRQVPRSVQSDLILVGQAAQLARHPHLSRLHQPGAVDAALARATAHLKSIDPADRRRGAILHWAGENAINILILAGLFVAVLVWRGFV